MRPFSHPTIDAISLSGVLYALSDPSRLAIIARLDQACANCADASPKDLPRSTLSFHLSVLREAGLIRSARKGAEVVNTLRREELDARFPGLLGAILQAGKPALASCRTEGS